MSSTFLQINPTDNLLVALQDLKKGTIIQHADTEITLQDDIAAKHKFTTVAIPKDGNAYMYGVLVGHASQDIPRGGLIHTFNLHHASQDFVGKQKDYTWNSPDVTKFQNRTFNGYHRADGQVGTQNYWLVIPLVFCENRNIELLKNAFVQGLGFQKNDSITDQVIRLKNQYASGEQLSLGASTTEAIIAKSPLFPNVDGIKFLTHESGCGENKDDSMNLCTLLAGYCVNPNVGGISILSLGCQHSQIEVFKEKLKEKDSNFSKPIHFFEQQQDEGSGVDNLLNEVVLKTFEGLIEINKIDRKPAPLSALRLGVKCGGSDGFSGISANPAIGHTADLLVGLGGTVMIAEFPELCGVEQELQNRSVNAEVADNFGKMMREYAKRAAAVGAGFDMNPSPGNIKDGLITDAIKSAGAAKKAGSSPIVDALGYGQYATQTGLNLVCTPGNDVLATTGMAGAGATIQLFTTGLGTPTGNPISPMVKLSTNTRLAEKLPEIIDIDCGPIIRGEKTVEEMGEEVLEYIIQLASGEITTKAMDLGQDDFMFWRRGVSL
ncbi:UxaA family hydrolase [Aquirufa regiilacus]|uniref:Altronate dehydratase family protein n=1 Tax=Aquirufa regiilacus TaxID=3024868 RepID=A0ABU3TQK7_9BACT|nr:MULTISPECIES: altronate dehydratase family protein [unclassified Aquirufa]MDT8886888.1 altronate dehydratase family protein [Aquirufa sp. LEPPI-3A]MDU0808147.1 altronate dehydratase family protein [Aquirufa sp. LEOWEIH-7C]